METFDEYYKALGIARPEVLTLEALNQVVRAHMRAFPYQNFGILSDASSLKSDPYTMLGAQKLLDALVEKKQGGMCYELSSLLLHALKDLGFTVEPVQAIPRLGDTSTDSAPYAHQILIVELDGQAYLVDPAFGYSGIYGTLSLYDEDREFTEPETGNRYLTEWREGFCRLSCWMSEKWYVFYDFNWPKKSSRLVKAGSDYRDMVKKADAPICWKYLKLGKMRLTSGGNVERVGVHVALKGAWRAVVMRFVKGEKTQEKALNDVSEIEAAVKRELGLAIPADVRPMLSRQLRDKKCAEQAAEAQAKSRLIWGICAGFVAASVAVMAARASSRP